MKKLILLAVSITMIFAQQGEYVRKSVSSLESVWYKADALEDVHFDAKTFDMFMKHYIEIDRFDYNVLPSNLLENFRRESNLLTDINATSLAGVLENTVTSKIVEILNDPGVMENRGSALKDEAAFQSFAATKAKSLGLTTDELKALMNSAFIYLPYIKSATQKVEDKTLTFKMEGGIIWWQLKVDEAGNSSVVKIKEATTSGISSLDPESKNSLTGESSYARFKFGDTKWPTTPEQYAQNDAMLAFAKNLGVKTKEIDDFKLTAQIVEASGKSYGFNLGTKEGVHLDDGFHLVEYEENAAGDEVAVKAGFIRVSKTGDNRKDPNNYSYANQLLGKKVSEGTVVLEHPRLGMDVRAHLGIMSGSSILPEHTSLSLAYGGNLFAEEATTQLAGDVIISYNLAPIIGVSQTFVDLDLGFSLPLATYADEDNESASAFAMILSPYIGVSKRVGGQMFAGANLAAGVDILSLSGTATIFLVDVDYQYNIAAPGLKLGGELGFMVNPDLSITASAGYKLGIAPLSGSLTVDDVDYEINADYIEANYEDLNMGGLMINVGASYALGELPINVFGFLDPLKKY